MKPSRRAIVSGVGGPVNVYLRPGVPDLGTLQKIGIARASVGSGLFHVAQRAITDAVEAYTEELVRQICRTLHFMETQRRHLQPTAIWLMGGGASMRNVDALLSRALPLPVHLWRMPAETGQIACAAAGRSAVFGIAAALSAGVWSEIAEARAA